MKTFEDHSLVADAVSLKGPDHDRAECQPEEDRGQDRSDHDQGHDRDRNRERRHEHDQRDCVSREYHLSKHSGEEFWEAADHERSVLDADSYRCSSSHQSRSHSQSWTRSHGRDMPLHGSTSDHHPSPFRDTFKDRTTASVSSNLAKLKDLYGDGTYKMSDGSSDRLNRDSGTEVIRLDGSTRR